VGGGQEERAHEEDNLSREVRFREDQRVGPLERVLRTEWNIKALPGRRAWNFLPSTDHGSENRRPSLGDRLHELVFFRNESHPISAAIADQQPLIRERPGLHFTGQPDPIGKKP
jgi:hypothetical protein